MQDVVPAKISRKLVSQIVESFPVHRGWRVFRCTDLVRPKSKSTTPLDWSVAASAREEAGIYGFFFPANQFAAERTIKLIGPVRGGVAASIPFTFIPPTIFEIDGSEWVLLYIGKSHKLCERWKMHFGNQERKNGGQVRKGLEEAGLCGIEETREWIVNHALIAYRLLPGPDNAANRDIVEVSLHARFHPAFNIKAER